MGLRGAPPVAAHLLRLDPWAPRGKLRVHPELPPWIRKLRVAGIAIAGQKITVEVDGDDVEISGAGGLEVTLEPRMPLAETFAP